MVIEVSSTQGKYQIILEKDSLKNVYKHCNLNRKVMIITDEGVPRKYVDTLIQQCSDPYLIIVKQGEQSKSFATYEKCLNEMLDNNFSRKDLVIALGGGVVGDLSGFVSATYMRGIDFVNIPTTTLSQIDSSIGGKVAINSNDVKNCVGAFWQPKLVVIDTNVLDTLESNIYNEGLAEAIKAGLIGDKELFEMFENEDVKENIEKIIYKSLMVKKYVVEKDEKELDLRRILNFGHTIGHAYESYYELKGYCHGDCVAMGMMAILDNEEIKERLRKVLIKNNLPTTNDANPEKVFGYLFKDKKADKDQITIVQVDEIGKAKLIDMSIEQLRSKL